MPCSLQALLTAKIVHACIEFMSCTQCSACIYYPRCRATSSATFVASIAGELNLLNNTMLTKMVNESSHRVYSCLKPDHVHESTSLKTHQAAATPAEQGLLLYACLFFSRCFFPFGQKMPNISHHTGSRESHGFPSSRKQVWFAVSMLVSSFHTHKMHTGKKNIVAKGFGRSNKFSTPCFSFNKHHAGWAGMLKHSIMHWGLSIGELRDDTREAQREL
jgi:hypothetical protein